jgi:hypothetical protein
LDIDKTRYDHRQAGDFEESAKFINLFLKTVNMFLILAGSIANSLSVVSGLRLGRGLNINC